MRFASACPRLPDHARTAFTADAGSAAGPGGSRYRSSASSPASRVRAAPGRPSGLGALAASVAPVDPAATARSRSDRRTRRESLHALFVRHVRRLGENPSGSVTKRRLALASPSSSTCVARRTGDRRSDHRASMVCSAAWSLGAYTSS
jgi:hypothetical protein